MNTFEPVATQIQDPPPCRLRPHLFPGKVGSIKSPAPLQRNQLALAVLHLGKVGGVQEAVGQAMQAGVHARAHPLAPPVAEVGAGPAHQVHQQQVESLKRLQW